MLDPRLEDFDKDAFMASLKERMGMCAEEKLLYQKIDESTESIVPIYDQVCGFLFQDVSFAQIEPFIPDWIVKGGISPENGMSKKEYECYRKSYCSPLINRLLHWYDVEFLLHSIQDRIWSVSFFAREFFRIVPCVPEDSNIDVHSASFTLSEKTATPFAMVNAAFIALASTFDLVSKLAIELAEIGRYDFAHYKKMRSADTLFKQNLKVWPELQIKGALFHENADVAMIETLRNDYVHDRSWTTRSPVYYPQGKNGELLPPFMPIPDDDGCGHFVTSGSRRKFYSRQIMLNQTLVGLISRVLEVVDRTVVAIGHGCLSRTNRQLLIPGKTADFIAALHQGDKKALSCDLSPVNLV